MTTKSRIVWIAVASLLVCNGAPDASGQGVQRSVSQKEVAATVPAEFKVLFGAGVPGNDLRKAWADLPYEALTFERTGCLGVCPVYRVTLRRGGQADLHAISWQGKKGDFSSTINILDYGKLCYLLRQLRFEQLSERYATLATDHPTAIVTAVSKGSTKQVADYGPVGPIELWAIQQAFDGVLQSLQWTAK